MDLYGIALFIHMLGVITMFGAFVLLQRVGAQVREAETAEQLRSSIGILRPLGQMFTTATVFLLASGLYMTAQVWTFTTSWVVVGIATILMIMGLGSSIPGRRLGQIAGAAMKAPAGPLPDELRLATKDPMLWMVATLNSAAALGVVWLMTNKPGWVVSIAVVVVLAAAGAFSGRSMAARP
jgi:protein-S-isoprenylcysteine O-methyltransferase Ste14